MTDLRAAAEGVVRVLRADGHEALFAGGCVRDTLLGRPVREIDIATSARPERVEALFPKTVAVGKAFGVILVLEGPHRFEVATFRSDGRYLDGRRPESVTFSGAREDALRRDFTINGMFLDPEGDRIVDYVEGRRDLERRLVRAIGDPRARFAEDRLRLLRAPRFAAQLGFAIEEATAAAIREAAPAVTQISGERVRDELAKMLVHPTRSTALQLLKDLGLLAVVLPEIDALAGVPQPPDHHPEGDVWVHTKRCLDTLREPSFDLALAVLLHDVGKPRCIAITDRIRFHGHDKVGAEMAHAICERLRLSLDQTSKVCWLVERHLAFLSVDQMRRSTLKRLFASEHIEDLLAVVRADSLGAMGNASFVDRLAEMRASMGEPEYRPVPLVTGEDLIRLGHTPGPEFGRVLHDVMDAQLEGSVRTREEALALAKRLIGGP